MKVSPVLVIVTALACLCLPACQTHKEEEHHAEHHKIVVTSPVAKSVVSTRHYVCQIHSQRCIEVRALQEGYLEQIQVREGQAVKTGDELFKIRPTLYKSRLDAELAEAQLAQLEFNNTKKLYEQKVVSIQEVSLFEAKLAKAQAKATLAEAELNFTSVKAPFDGLIDRLLQQQGSLVKKEDLLTTLSDNSTMWVYFNVPEVRYLEYKASTGQDIECPQIELVLANGSRFPQTCKAVTSMGQVNNETGNFSYRADFPNPDRLLRHGQTGMVLVHRTLENAIVIPQRATFEILDKRYVFVVDKEGVVRQREIVVEHEMDDIFVIKKEEVQTHEPKLEEIKHEEAKEEPAGKDHHHPEHAKKEAAKKEPSRKGLNANDRIIIEGVRQVHDGEKVEFEFHRPEAVLANQKNHAE